jgi:hypothetical protein
MSSSHSGQEDKSVFEFESVPKDKLEKVVSSIDWKALFDAEKAMWYQTVASKLDLKETK